MLTPEQRTKLQSAGYTPEKISAYEAQRGGGQTMQTPSMPGFQQPSDSPSLLGQEAKAGYENLMASGQRRGQAMAQPIADWKAGKDTFLPSDKSLGALGKTIEQGISQTAGGIADTFAEVAKRTGSLILNTLGIKDQTKKVMGDYINYLGSSEIAPGLTDKTWGDATSHIAQKTKEFTDAHPEFATHAETVGNLLNAYLSVTGFEQGAIATGNQLNKVKNVTAGTLKSMGGVTKPVSQALKSAGRSAYGLTVPMEEGTSKALLGYEAKQGSLLNRIRGELTGTGVGTKPITEADTAARMGLVGTEREIGIQAKQFQTQLWDTNLSPKLGAVKKATNMRQFFSELEDQIVKDTPELARKSELLEGLEALKADYKSVGDVGGLKLQEYKSGWAENLPQKAWKGKDIAGSYNQVKKLAASKARGILYDVLGEESKLNYIDYGNLQSVVDAAVKAPTGDAAKRSFGRNVWEAVMDKAVTPVATAAGKVLYRTGEGLEFIGDIGAKKVGDIIQGSPNMLEAGANLTKDMPMGLSVRKVKVADQFDESIKRVMKDVQTSDPELWMVADDYLREPTLANKQLAIEEFKLKGIDLAEPTTQFTPDQAKLPNLKGKKANPTMGEIAPFKDTGEITTKLLSKLEGKTTVSKQFIEDLSNAGDMRQPERDLIRKMLANEGDKVNVPDFANKVKTELLPLKRETFGDSVGGAKYEGVSLPDEQRGPVANYSEHIYQSPIKTSAGNVHFDTETAPEYFAHTRIEDLADPKTRRVIELQSDLFQKGRLEKEIDPGYANSPRIEELMGISPIDKTSKQKAELEKLLKEYTDTRTAETSKLEPYRNTWHERIIREEVKQAAKDGKTKLQFPTGETAIKIEGLGDNTQWYHNPSGKSAISGGGLRKITPEELKVGGIVDQGGEGTTSSEWIITDVLGDGKFKAVPKSRYKYDPEQSFNTAKEHAEMVDAYSETFDISGKVDTSNPIYKFYEKDVQKFLNNQFGGKRVKDSKGVEWIEVDVKPEMKKAPVKAFGSAKLTNTMA